jgi:hypothetical protein
MNKIVNWIEFSRFVNDEAFWSRWTFQLGLEDNEQYFIDCYNAAKEKRNLPYFDFNRTYVTLLSIGDDHINWEHDGESIWYFFEKWYQGVRL